jgi:hypothetical protein
MRIDMSASGDGAVPFQLAAFQLLTSYAHSGEEVAHLPLVRRLEPCESVLIGIGCCAEGEFESRVKATIAITSQVKAMILVNMRVILPSPLFRHCQPSPIHAQKSHEMAHPDPERRI